ncbi:hypothetical protein PPL_11501 [Heterostelium album PN500]|uniref:Nudix hydrolase domain-containing protein n=1 Tax=Heterostelium pallidum (strain ATCC 26659 / Pp 5 / PN500) TaxID=670386 RepID=D3BTK4_HETP5|nr:hypothetical protein PPL_11501 [Heterostelium album PN500]EFA75421.1 hypothetical protein PPL_11501 [Heterostelium album PN500]|eukprot:XP_020427555.1 hypothetical protein PPL_11501 [Heterostelium album PN500]
MSSSQQSFRKAASAIVALKWEFSKPPPFSVVDKVKPPKNFDYRIMMVKRSPDLRSFPQAHVFPGGAFDKSDASHLWTQYLGTANIDLGLRITAMREVFEETNFFIGGVNDTIFESQSVDTVQSARNMVLMCNVKPRIDNINEWSRWITPEHLKHRFDTYFYLAPIYGYPYSAVVDGTENTHLDWFSPEEALEEHDRGTIFLPPPQWLTMLQMSRFHTLEELMAESAVRHQLNTVYSPTFVKSNINQKQLASYNGGKTLKLANVTHALNNDPLNTSQPGSQDQKHRINIQSKTGDISDPISWVYHYENNLKSHIDQVLDQSICKSYKPINSICRD